MPVRYSPESAGPSTRQRGNLPSLPFVGEYENWTYENWSKPELVAELERRGLPKTGNKPDLIARLEESDSD